MALHPHLSFCRVQEQFVFLDLARNRYFMLGAHLSQAFAAQLAGTADDEARRRLQHHGLLGHGGMAIAACAGSVPMTSLLDAPAGRGSAARVIALAWTFARVRRKLRRAGLAGPAAELTALRARSRISASAKTNVRLSTDRDRLAASVRAYERLALLRGSYDLCLPHSLALAMRLLREGLAADVVLGVQTRPFGAHCWVESQGELVNDRFDRVRSYTPIRRL